MRRGTETKIWDLYKKEERFDIEEPLKLSFWHKTKKIFLVSAVFLLGFGFIGSGTTLYINRNNIKEKAFASVDKLQSQSQNILLKNGDLKNLNPKLKKIEREIRQIQEIITSAGLSGNLLEKYDSVGRELSYPQRIIKISVDLRKLISILEKMENPQSSTPGNLKSYFEESLDLTQEIIVNVETIKDSGWLDSKKFESFTKTFNEVSDQLLEIIKIGNFLPEIMGFGGNKHYLILLQNNREIRPIGGFIGSFGLLDFSNGKISKPYIQDVYYLRFLKKTVFKEDIEKEKKYFPISLRPPKKIRDYNAHWNSLYDGNWEADFGKSAKSIEWTFDHTYHQGQVDGVFALDPSIIEELLTLTGPVDLPSYGTSITADNFRDVMQYKVEVDNPFKKKIDKTISPKQILSDFGDIFFYKLSHLSSKKYQTAASKFILALKEKHILLYFNNPRLQSISEELNFSGRIKATAGDYLHIGRTNISATKSSQAVAEEVIYHVSINPDSTLKSHLKINRILKTKTGFLDHHDKSWIQVYAPSGAKIKSVESQDGKVHYETFSALGKQVFTLVSDLYNKERDVFDLEYSPGIVLKKDSNDLITYDLLVQKQPGINSDNFTLAIDWPENWKIINGPKLKLLGKNSGVIKQQIFSDTSFSLKFQKI